MKKLTLFTAMIFAIGTLTAQIIHVPADQPTIQEGINAASDGDTVLVAEDTYLENINFMGKAITVASNFILDGDTSHISNTIIDGSQPDDPDIGSVVTLESGEDITSILIGVTITGGTGSIVQQNNVRVGGGINLINSGASILYNIIYNNNIIHQYFASGGGIDAMTTFGSASLLILSNNKISNNTVTSTFQADGGGVYIGMNAQILNNDISSNELFSQGDYSFGGGIRITPAFVPIEVEIKGNHFSYNSATCVSESKGGIGGGFYITSNLELTASISGNTIEYNTVVGDNSYGAGAFVRKVASDFVFENNIIKNNIATDGECNGGGLTVWYGGGTYQNNVIQNNMGTWGGGICAIHNNSDSLAILINNTVTGNHSAYGGGLYMNLADAVVINTILWDNEASEEGPEIFVLESNLEVRNSDVEGGWPGNGNIDVDPVFRNDGYHLYYPSELVNAGVSTLLINGEWYDCPEYDIDGDERPFESTEPDIGADEALWYYVGVDEQSKTDVNVIVYPNPASSIINFSIQNSNTVRSGGNKITLFNTDGRYVYESKITESDFSININYLPSGIYFAKLNLGEFMINKKIVINR